MKKRFAILIVLIITLNTMLYGCSNAANNVSPGDSNAGAGAASTEAKSPNTSIKLKVAAQESEEHGDVKSLRRAAEAINEKTGGAVELTIYPSSQLGDYTQVYDEIIAGTIDMACITIPTSYDKRLEMLTIPYLITNYEDAERIFLGDSEFRKQLDAIQKEYGIHTLALYMDGFMGIGATKSIDDIMNYNGNHSGVLMRCPSADSYIWTAKAMNFSTTTIAYSDLYSALQTGVCDGWVGGSAYVNYLNFRDVVKYFCDNRYIMEIVVVIINENTFNRIPEEYRNIITEVFQAESLEVANAREALDEQAMTDMAAMGIEIVVPSQEDLDKMREHFKETVWPNYKDLLGEELYATLIGNA